ncbi:MAG: hypothetical protein Q8P60_10975, partial [Pseudorhodobacter sp.]|nr:hypothetical protein [Pseudorhodobacter sp.]
MRLNLIPLVLLPLLLGLAGCQALPGAKRGGAEPVATVESPITGGEIAVTALDAPTTAAALDAPADEEPA